MILGIDLGTTKTAAVLYDPAKPAESRAESAVHHAALPAAPGRAEQDMETLVESVRKLLNRFSVAKLAGVEAVGLTGQMHSILLRNETECSPVITWQDRRASEAGELKLLQTASGLPLADGFGGTTLGFLRRSGELARWRHAATPAGFLAMRLTGKSRAGIDPSFAASWGIYDRTSGGWNRAALAALGIPEQLLPAPCPFGTLAGRTAGFAPLPDGIPVFTPLGDNQASIAGSSEDLEREVFVTIGTGAQLSIVLTAAEAAAAPAAPGVELRPYPGNRLLAVTAPLCGGRAWSWLGKSVNGFLSALGLPPFPENELLDRLDVLASEAAPESGIRVAPSFLGERSTPERRGSIGGITLDNFTLPNLAAALADGIVRQLAEPMPPELLRSRRRIAGSGNALRLCASLRARLEEQLELPLEIRETNEEAAAGAAKYAHSCLKSKP